MKKFFALFCVVAAMVVTGCAKKESAPASAPAAAPADKPAEEPAK